MSDSELLIIFLALAFASLFIVSYVNRQQTRKRLVNSKFNQLKRLASDYVETGLIIESLLESPNILKVVNNEVIQIIHKMQQLNPDSPFIAIGLENAEFRRDELENPEYTMPINRAMDSDASVARAQSALTEAAKIVRNQQTHGQIELGEMEMYIRDLSWAYMMVSVITLIGQGHKATNRADILRAHAFYKKALEKATQSGHKEERQDQLISEIGEILSNRRKALSIELMPETHLNPGQTA